MKRHIAVDIGSESGRVIAGWLEDGRLVTDVLYRFKTQFVQMRRRSVRNFYRYHEEILKGLRLYAEKYGPELASIGVDAWGADFVLLDRAGDIMKLPQSYRTFTGVEDVLDIIERKFGLRALYDINGNQRQPSDTLNQLLRLIRDGHPSLDDPRGILFVSDMFHYLLGAEPCCEHSLASYSGFWNQRENRWDADIMRAFGIPDSLCSKVVYAGDTVGYVDEKILRDAGIEGPVAIITPCAHDTSTAALAIADLGSDWAFVSSGTWSLMGFETDAPVINDISFRYNFSNSTMPLRTNMFKKNITGTWLVQQCCEAWRMNDYNAIVDLTEASPDNDWIIDVNAAEFYAPDSMPRAIAASVKRDFGADVDPDDKGTICRIAFQSMAVKYRYYLERLLKAADKRISKLYIISGGSRNRVINQFAANACRIPVSTGVYEASSVGNLLLQAYGCSELRDKPAMRQVVIDTFPQTVFEPRDAELWEKKYRAYESVAQPNAW